MPTSPAGLELPPLSLYIHIPWCVRKCPYCDFNSHEASGAYSDQASSAASGLPEREYVDALIADLKEELAGVQGRKLHSIFIGGGTPSLFSPGAISKVLDAADQFIGFEPNIEITMEANPGTFEQDKFKGFRAAGINRLSIGIQSFSDQQLNALGRIHGREEALRAVDMARKAGFDNINLDLMHGLPAQPTEGALEDLQQAIALQPEHISWYQLTIEPNTEFYSRPPTLPVEDELAAIQQDGEALLAAHGYCQYEVSAYARSTDAHPYGRRSQHNLNYWQFGDYLGIGAGAHGKVTDIAKQRIIRRHKTRLPGHYLDNKRAYCAGETLLDQVDLPLEFMMNVLRLVEGVPTELATTRGGVTLDAFEPQLTELRQKKLLTPDRLQTTALGQRFLNEVLSSFM